MLNTLKYTGLVFFSAMMLLNQNVLAADDADSSPKFSGYMFGDYYWAAKSHNPDIEDKNGFQFRRIYLTMDKNVNENFDIRFRLEAGNPGDFSSTSKIEPFAKDAWLRYKNGAHSIYMGLSPTPSVELVDKHWGYRSVEKSALDLNKFASSRDFGVKFSGTLGAKGKARYNLMLANGAGTKTEVSPGKKVIGTLGFQVAEGLMIDFIGDYEARPGDANRSTMQAFLSYSGSQGRIGALYARQTRQGVNTLHLDVTSIYGVANFNPRLNGYIRWDRMYDPNPDGEKISYYPFDKTAKSNFILIGLDYTPHEDVHIMPNIEYTFYNPKAGADVNPDFMPRMTMWYLF
jgi:hypothetical protein